MAIQPSDSPLLEFAMVALHNNYCIVNWIANDAESDILSTFEHHSWAL